MEKMDAMRFKTLSEERNMKFWRRQMVIRTHLAIVGLTRANANSLYLHGVARNNWHRVRQALLFNT
jgi:hypothetical protein